MKKILITGASGYIGKHITLQLLNEGYEVRASVRNLTKSLEVKNAVLPYLIDLSNIDSRLTFVELDLNKDSGWDAALQDIDLLMHTASPFPLAKPKDENELTRPAVEGTLRALNAAKRAGVNRVIITSSVAAVWGFDLPVEKSELDETMWTDINHPLGKETYNKSKTLAESAAWNFIKNSAPEISLTTINPVIVLGAPLDDKFGTSVSLIDRFMKGRDPMLPDINMSIVDVRDVAFMHVQAIKIEATKGERILAASESMPAVGVTQYLKSIYPKSKIKTAKAPNFLIKFIALFDAEIKSVLPMLGRPFNVNNAKAKRLFNIEFISAKESIRDTADYLLKNGYLKM